jgi:NADH pyrophosphatase NudC (nudix superfamily)
MTEWNRCPQCGKELTEQESENGEVYPACPDRHYTHYGSPSPTAGSIIERGRKYLVLQRAIEPNKGKWEICGGFIDAGESAEECALRELKEELQVTGTIIRYIGSAASEYGDTGIKTTGVSFLVDIGDQELRPDPKEIMDYRWVGLHEFPPMAHQDDQRIVDLFVAQESR